MAVHVRTGYFVKEKVGNMVRWARNELGDDVVPETLQHAILRRSETEMLYVVGILKTHEIEIEERDWDGITSSVAIPDEFKSLVSAIRAKESMHDKFWRYLELFCEIVSNEL